MEKQIFIYSEIQTVQTIKDILIIHLHVIIMYRQNVMHQQEASSASHSPTHILYIYM